MLTTRRLWCLALSALSLCALFLTVFTPVTYGQFGGLVSRIPHGANTIVILDVEKIMESSLATAENWQEERQKAAEAGVSLLPPTATQFIMAAEMDFEFMQPSWEVSLARLSEEASLPNIAARWNGQVDRVEKRNTVRLPDDSYIVQFGKDRVGAYRPGNRQRVARWLRETDTNTGDRLPPYLQQALSYAKDVGTPIIMAMDMHHVVAEDALRQRLESMGALMGKDVDLDRVAKAMASAQGITLGVSIKDQVFGSLKVEFEEDVEFLGDLAKPMLLEVLGRRGAMIDEFATWKPTVSGKRVQISGPLQRSGLQRILSILDAPNALQESSNYSPGEGANPEELTRLASQQYFKSVEGLINDLKGRPKQTMGQIGHWFGRYAQKIDSLPLLNVDPGLLDYGGFVSTSFRDAETSLKDVGGRSRVRESNAPRQYNYAGRWGAAGGYGRYGMGGGYGYAYVAQEDLNEEFADRARIRTEERVSGAKDARGIMQDVASATGEIRRKMTEKYQVEF